MSEYDKNPEKFKNNSYSQDMEFMHYLLFSQNLQRTLTPQIGSQALNTNAQTFLDAYNQAKLRNFRPQ